MLAIQEDLFVFGGGNGDGYFESTIFKLSCSSGICSWSTLNQALEEERRLAVAIPVPESFCLDGEESTTTPSGNCYQGWIGDNYCDDINNYVECNFDGGDCCGSNVNTQYCTECLCLEGGGGGGSEGTTTSSNITITGPVACSQGWVGDGYCDDINNNVGCNFDGGDCCGPNVNTAYCLECLCLEE